MIHLEVSRILCIGEGIKQIDEHSDGILLPERPEIPWRDVIGARNRIAHGYFEVDAETSTSTLKSSIASLLRMATLSGVRIGT